jgi:hypothetical protein
MALTVISLVLLGFRNEQQRVQTMLTVLTQTCRAVIDFWIWSSRAAACSAGLSRQRVASAEVNR